MRESQQQQEEACPIFKHVLLVETILSFSHPRTAFDARLVSKTWNEVVSRGSSSFWRYVVGACLPWCALTLQLLEQATPKYKELRHFSKMSLANTKTLQHILVCDITNHPVLWLTNVACTTRADHLYKAVAKALEDFLDVDEIALLAAGVPLERTKTIDAHHWPFRGDKKGWRLDMWVVVRGFHYSRAVPKVRPTISCSNQEEDNTIAEKVMTDVEAPIRLVEEPPSPLRSYPNVFPVDLDQYLSCNE
jgi:hypothetical protein